MQESRREQGLGRRGSLFDVDRIQRGQRPNAVVSEASGSQAVRLARLEKAMGGRRVGEVTWMREGSDLAQQ